MTQESNPEYILGVRVPRLRLYIPNSKEFENFGDVIVSAELVKETKNQIVVKTKDCGEIRFKKNFDGDLSSITFDKNQIIGTEYGNSGSYTSAYRLHVVNKAQTERAELIIKIGNLKAAVGTDKLKIEDYEKIFEALGWNK